jgi:Trp operon repressor
MKANFKEIKDEFLMTPKERNALPKRWEIVRRLYKGESQWSIAGDLKLGIGTVTRGSKELKKPNNGFIKILKLLKK